MPLPKATIRGIQAFLAVYEEQSFSRAAARENATQSGMSTQVMNLEEALGTPLLIRRRGEIALTSAGTIAYRRGQQILRDLFDLEARVESLQAAVSGTIRFGVIPTLTRAVLPRAIKRYRSDYPQVEVTVIEEYSYSLMRRVAAGELDCAAVPAGDILSGLTASYLAGDSEVLAAPPDFRPELPHLAPVEPADLNGLRMILPSSINVRRRGLEQYFASHGVLLADVVDMDAMLGTLELIGHGGWCAILPAAICFPDAASGQRKLHPLTTPAISTEYVIVRKTEQAQSQAAGLLVEALADAAREIRKEWDQLVERLA